MVDSSPSLTLPMARAAALLIRELWTVLFKMRFNSSTAAFACRLCRTRPSHAASKTFSPVLCFRSALYFAISSFVSHAPISFNTANAPSRIERLLSASAFCAAVTTTLFCRPATATNCPCASAPTLSLLSPNAFTNPATTASESTNNPPRTLTAFSLTAGSLCSTASTRIVTTFSPPISPNAVTTTVESISLSPLVLSLSFNTVTAWLSPLPTLPNASTAAIRICTSSTTPTRTFNCGIAVRASVPIAARPAQAAIFPSLSANFKSVNNFSVLPALSIHCRCSNVLRQKSRTASVG